MMAASSFGNEFQSRTLALLLAQPMPRSRIWRDKIAVLGAALGIAGVVAALGIVLLIRGEGKPGSIQDLTLGLIGLAMVALCSTPIMTLATKNIIGGMGAAVALAMSTVLLIMATDWVISWLLAMPDIMEHPFLSDSVDAHPYAYILSLVGTYCAVFYWLGYRTFVRLQLIDTQAQEINLPAKLEATLGPLLLRLMPSYTGPTASLIRKELQLHRPSFIIAGAASALLVVEAAVFEMHISEITIGMMFTSVVLCVFLIPLITAAMALAEERNWGLAGWQLTLPPSAAKQWLTKMIVALAICLALGVALPLAMVTVMKVLFAAAGQGPTLGSTGEIASNGTILCYLFLLSLIFYASSISTNVMRAVIAALGLIIGMGSVWGLVNYLFYQAGLHTRFGYWLLNTFSNDQLVRISRACWHVLPAFPWVLILLFLGLVFYNFRSGELTARRRWAQLSALGLLVLVMSAAFMPIFAMATASENIRTAAPTLRSGKAPPSAKP